MKNLKLALADIKDSIKTKAGMEEAFGSKFSKIYETYSKKLQYLGMSNLLLVKIGTTENGTRLKLNPQQTKLLLLDYKASLKKTEQSTLRLLKC